MDITNKVFKRKSGKSKGKWVVRIEYFDEIAGKTKCMERHAEKRSEAIDEQDRLINDLKKSHGQMQTGERMTFHRLADICESTFYKPAVIVEGKKVDGVRSYESVRFQINNLRAFFGKRFIKELTTESLVDYKLWRLRTESAQLKRPVKIATINRELSAMRKMMRFAFGKGWILRDIFFNAKVIDSANEVERSRLLTKSEETALLAGCEGEREIHYERTIRGEKRSVTARTSVNNSHLKAMIILALDSGLRRGEIFKLRWQDIDFVNSVVRVVGTHTKTERERLAPLSQRAKIELGKIRGVTPGENPFPFTDIKRSFATAKRIAGIGDLHFHDLRRTAITGWIQQGNPIALAGKLAGHSQLQTTMKHYNATDVDIVRRISENMDVFHGEMENRLASEMVN